MLCAFMHVHVSEPRGRISQKCFQVKQKQVFILKAPFYARKKALSELDVLTQEHFIR